MHDRLTRRDLIRAAGLCAIGSFAGCANSREYDAERDFITVSGIVAADLGPAVCYAGREAGEDQLREISRKPDGYQDWIFIERPEGSIWASLTSEIRPVRVLGYRIFSTGEIKSLMLIGKGNSVTHYVTCPDTGKDVDYYSLNRNLPSPQNFLESKKIKDETESRRGIFKGSISISPHFTCEFGNTGTYTSEASIGSRLYRSLNNIFSKKAGIITDDKLAELEAALDEEGLFLRIKRHPDNQQR